MKRISAIVLSSFMGITGNTLSGLVAEAVAR